MMDFEVYMMTTNPDFEMHQRFKLVIRESVKSNNQVNHSSDNGRAEWSEL